jgi:hypothetical protein
MLRATVKGCKYFPRFSLCKFSTNIKVFSQDVKLRYAENTEDEPVFEFTNYPSSTSLQFVEEVSQQPLEENVKYEETIEQLSWDTEQYSWDTEFSTENPTEHLKGTCSLTGAEIELTQVANPLPGPWYEAKDLQKDWNETDFQQTLNEYGMRL